MTPASRFWPSIVERLHRARRALLGPLGRRHAPIVLIADADLPDYTGLTRADLDRLARDPVWSQRAAGLDLARLSEPRPAERPSGCCAAAL